MKICPSFKTNPNNKKGLALFPDSVLFQSFMSNYIAYRQGGVYTIT